MKVLVNDSDRRLNGPPQTQSLTYRNRTKDARRNATPPTWVG